jgi:hypothetical protein
MWPRVTARATLPHTSVDATTTAAAGCPEPPVAQPVSAAEAMSTADSHRTTLTSVIAASFA